MRNSLSILILVTFLISSVIGPIPSTQAQDFRLPALGVMVHLSPPYDPPILKGIKVHPDNPFCFDFILDQGDSPSIFKEGVRGSLKQEATRLIKYFLASLTIPEKDLWVNLSPYEKDRIIPQSFGLTEMGRDLLAEDYMLKQITASLIYPEDEIGKKFWKRIYEEAYKKFGTTNVPVNTFNKVWIVPEKAVVYENAKAGTAYVVESKLKVMLEQDYLSLDKHEGIQSKQAQAKDANQLGSQIVREIVIPELTKEINENKNFAELRQVYSSLILATWYKKKIKDSILAQVYEDKNVEATQRNKPDDVEVIYHRYLQSFKKGVYNYIKEEKDPFSKEIIPRKYFSGGILLITSNLDFATLSDDRLEAVFKAQKAKSVEVQVDLIPEGRSQDQAQESSSRYSKMVQMLSRTVSDSILMSLKPDRILKIFPDQVGIYSGKAVIAVNDKYGIMHTYVDLENSDRVNIRQVPDLNPEGMSHQKFTRATEMLGLYAYQSTGLTVRKFRGWDLLPVKLKETLSGLFSENLVPLTLRRGKPMASFGVALETNRHKDDAPGRTGSFLYNNGFVVVKDTNGRELLLEVTGIGPFDGTFELRPRTVYRGSVDQERITTQTTVARGYLETNKADAISEHLQALEREPASELSIQSVPVFQVDFYIEGQPFSLVARLSPGNRRLGQYWKGTELPEGEMTKSAQILGKSVAAMLLERRPVVHTAFSLENILDTPTEFASYGNPGDVVYLDTQRRAFIFMKQWLLMAEEKVTHRWGHEQDPSDDELAQIFWNGFIDLFLGVVDFLPEVRQELEGLHKADYSEDKRDRILSLIWKNYLIQQIFEARLRHGYQPSSFLQPTYPEETDILPPMHADSGWLSEERSLYDDLLDSEYGKRHAVQIMAQREQLETIAKEKYPHDDAMASNGGIDLTPANKILQTQNGGIGIKFHLDQAQLAQWQNAPGVTIDRITILPLKSFQEFLDIDATNLTPV